MQRERNERNKPEPTQFFKKATGRMKYWQRYQRTRQGWIMNEWNTEETESHARAEGLC